MNAIEVPFGGGPLEVFRRVHHRPYAFLLESALATGRYGRYSIVGYDPALVVRGGSGGAEWVSRDGKVGRSDDGWALLQRLHAEGGVEESDQGLPFGAGAYGYFSYEAGMALERLTSRKQDRLPIPDIAFGFYHWVLVADVSAKRMWVVLGKDEEERGRAWAHELQHRVVPGDSQGETGPPFAASATANLTRAEYEQAINRIKAYIAAGDVYQVNLAQRFEAPLPGGDAFALYERLRRRSPAPYSAYLNFGDVRLVSSSPEQFLSVRGNRVSTRPIKGTRPRGMTQADDARLRDALTASEKDRAELLMIVDLERNDLGRVCAPGSIKVSELYRLEAHPTVWHLVAEVSGRLASGKNVFDLLRASFPGGSITGAPKIRAMEIIDELEPDPRHVYTGAIGYIGFNGNAEFNIAIRTVQCVGDRAYYHVGSGVVWDSQPGEEYEETLAKGRAMAEALGVTQREKAAP